MPPQTDVLGLLTDVPSGNTRRWFVYDGMLSDKPPTGLALLHGRAMRYLTMLRGRKPETEMILVLAVPAGCMAVTELPWRDLGLNTPTD